MITQIGYFNSVALAVACLVAIVSLKGNYKAIGVVLAVNFLMMIGYDALIDWGINNVILLAPAYSFKMLLQFAFLMIFVYLNAWLLAITSGVIIGILSYSIASTLYGINPLYYNEMMQAAVVAQLIAGLIGAFDGCRFTRKLYRRDTDRRGTGVTGHNGSGDHK